MHLRYIALTGLLFAFGCNNKAKEANQAAAAKSAQAAEIDTRAKAVAEDLIRKAADDTEKKQQTDKQQRFDARKALQQAAIDKPGDFLDSSKLEMAEKGQRHLTSISLTNKSKFSMTDIRGTVDYHGDGSRGTDGGILAQVPVELTGAIAPGASMVFSEQLHTLAGSTIQLPKTPTSVSFTVTSAKVGSEGLDTPPAPMAAAGGAPDGGSP
jgi:hypothetical protein